MSEGLLLEALQRHIGRTVTIFTTSGGISGAGFTGVLACVTPCVVKLITDVGAAPACPVGSACDGRSCGCGDYGYGHGGYGFGNGFYGYGSGGCGNGGYGCGNSCGGFGGFHGSNWLGSITEIPINRIASFTHNAI